MLNHWFGVFEQNRRLLVLHNSRMPFWRTKHSKQYDQDQIRIDAIKDLMIIQIHKVIINMFLLCLFIWDSKDGIVRPTAWQPQRILLPKASIHSSYILLRRNYSWPSGYCISRFSCVGFVTNFSFGNSLKQLFLMANCTHSSGFSLWNAMWLE